MSSLIRAVSWPLISTTPLDVSEKICKNENGKLLSNGKSINGIKHTPTFQQLIAARRLICRRYYPEGAWGWIILFIGVIANLLTHGLQLAAILFLMPAGQRFKASDVDCLGKLFLISHFLIASRRFANVKFHFKSQKIYLNNFPLVYNFENIFNALELFFSCKSFALIS